MKLTQEFVNSLFDYHEDGYLTWKVKRSKYSNIKIGDRAGCLHIGQNRWVIELNGVQYNLARIVFIWHKGYLPRVVDHENHITTDDRIENLRAATYSQNNKNKTSEKNSSSKYLGVSYYTSRNLWKVSIRVFGKPTFLGSYKTEEEGALAYNKAAVRHHGEFANLNIIIPTFTNPAIPPY